MAVFQNSNRDITTTVANGTGNLSVVGNLWTSANAYISGNLTVDGDITYINITELNVEDPIISMGRGPNNTPLTANDGKDRGDALWYYTTEEKTAFLGFHNSTGNLFAATDVTINNEIVTVNNYGNFIVGNLFADAITTDTIRANLGIINLVRGDLEGSVFADDSSVFFDATENSMFVGTASVAGNLYANVVDANYIVAPGLNSEILFNDNGFANGSPYLTFDVESQTLVAGNVTTENLNLTGNVLEDLNVNGNIQTAGFVSAVGNVIGNYFIGNGSLLSGISSSKIYNGTSEANIGSVNGNLNVSINGTSNVLVVANTGAFVTGVVSASGNVQGDYLLGNITFATGYNASKIFNGTSEANIGSANGNANISINGTSNVLVVANTGAYVNGLISASGNVQGDYLLGNITFATGYNASKIFNGTSEANIGTANGNANISINGTSNVLVVANTGAYVSGVVSSSGNITAPNATVSGTANIGTLNVSGNANWGNSGNGLVWSMNTDGASIMFYNTGDGDTDSRLEFNTSDNNTEYFRWTHSPSGGSLYESMRLATNGSGNAVLSVSGQISATSNITGGNVLTGGLVSAAGTVTGSSLLGSVVSASGNVTGGNVNTNNIVSSGTLNIVASTIALAPTGNVTMNSRYINNLATPAQDQDAATKKYVDDVAQGLNIHDATTAATPGNLASISGGTTTYYNGPTNNGAGATITTTGSYTTIDGVNIASANTRILVFNEANAVWNGVYVYSNSTVLTRATDYNSVPEVEAGDFIFNLSGTTYGNTGWVQTSSVSNIGQPGNNIVFTQFSGAGAYTANTSAGLVQTGTVFSAKVDNNTTAFDGSGNIVVKSGANLTTPNIGAATGTSLSLGGNITTGNVLTGGLVSAAGTVTGSSLLGSVVSASGNITGGNLLTGGLISATGNITIGNVLTGGLVSAAGTVTGSSLLGSVVSVSANITGGNILTGGLISAAGTVTGSSLLGSVVSVSANITGGNILTGGLISAAGNITGNNIAGIIRPTAGSGTAGIIFPPDPGGGSSDLAWIKYYATVGETTVLDIGVSNDNADVVYIHAPLGIGINNISPTVALDVTGDILASGDITAFSDARLKTDIETIVDPLTIIQQLRGVDYTNIESGERSSGVIAQEVQTTRPMLVRTHNGFLSVNYNGFSGVFIEALKDLTNQVNELKQEIKRLKGEQ